MTSQTIRWNTIERGKEWQSQCGRFQISKSDQGGFDLYENGEWMSWDRCLTGSRKSAEDLHRKTPRTYSIGEIAAKYVARQVVSTGNANGFVKAEAQATKATAAKLKETQDKLKRKEAAE